MGPNALFLKLLAGLYLWHTFLLARYGELEKEAQDLGVAKEPDVIELLNKLYPFAVDDITTLPYVQVRSSLIQQKKVQAMLDSRSHAMRLNLWSSTENLEKSPFLQTTE